MHCALRRTCSRTPKITNWENNSVPNKSLEENSCRTSSNECEVSSPAWRNSDHRRPVLTFCSVEPDGQWRIVALPFRCPGDIVHRQSGSQVKMDGLHLASPSLVSSVRVDQQKGRRGPSTETRSSTKSITSRRSSGSKCQYQSQNKGLPNKVSRWNALPSSSSCQTSFNKSDSSVIISTGSRATNASDTQITKSNVDEAIKRNPRKKAKKKGNRSKKLSCDNGSTDLESARGNATSETGVTKHTDHSTGSFPNGTVLAILSPESIENGNVSEGNSCGISSLEMPKLCTSYISEMNVLEAKFADEHLLSNTGNEVQKVFPEFSSLAGVQDTHYKPIHCSNDPCSSVFSETNDSSVFDSIPVCAGYSTKTCTKDIGQINLSEPPSYIARNRSFPHRDMLNGVEDCRIEGTNSCEHGSKSFDMARTGKQIKRVPRNSSASRLSTVGKFSGRSGKENSHSIWQKVQRNHADECTSGLRKVNSANSQSDAGLKEVPLLKKCSIAQSSVLSTCEDKNQSETKAPRKLKRKNSPGLNQELKYYSRKGPYATKASSNGCMKINMQRNEVLSIPSQDGGQKGLNSVSVSCSQIGCRSELQTNRVQSIMPEGRHKVLGPLEHVCANQLGFCDCQGQKELLEGPSTEYLNLPVGEGIKLNKDNSPVEHCKQEHSCESTLQKWIPVGIKDYELARLSHSNSLQVANLNKSAGESCTSENIAREMASDSDTSASSLNAIMCTVHIYRDDDALHSNNEVQIEKHPSQRTCIPNESCVNHVAAKCLRRDPKHHNKFAVENDSSKIAKAVNDAYKAQLASEAVEMANGCPIAEFERLLSSTTPVISLPHNLSSCQICLRHVVVGAPLCRHETPNVSLACLWQWYEKHGTYGLEVRAEDCDNYKRLGIDRVAFRAYFVPFLSAVQLFRNHKSVPLDSSSKAPGNENLGNSSIVRLPIFSVLLPKPRIEDTSFPSPKNCMCGSAMSSQCTEGNASSPSDDSTSSDDLELLFEYFEVEPPQQRRPLFEMVKELVRGDGPLLCRGYGDPTKLDSVSLSDLHHKSWYSVAWYPIYRIPDDNFRAAFLTYHSLGHLVRTSVTCDSYAVGASVVSPVAGLQSYNAQGECWLKLRQPPLSQTTEIPNMNPSGILKERLRTLEQTASLMARAVVTKGNLTSVNRQPDYEFFLSRHRW